MLFMVTRKTPRKHQVILQAYYRPNTEQERSNENKITNDFLCELSYQRLLMTLQKTISVYHPSPF
jgi:hypothetical protein